MKRQSLCDESALITKLIAHRTNDVLAKRPTTAAIESCLLRCAEKVPAIEQDLEDDDIAWAERGEHW
jgi:hypothetical protein